MPHVEWPKRRSHAKWMAPLVVGLVVVIFLQMFTLVPPTSAATVTSLPDNSKNSDNMTLVISQSSQVAVINAPNDYVKIYFDPANTGTGLVDIWNLPNYPCGQKTDPDWHDPISGCAGGPGNAATDQVRYQFFALDANEDAPPVTACSSPASPIAEVNGQTGWDTVSGSYIVPSNPGVWDNGLNVPLGGTTISNKTGYRVVLMRACFQTGLPGGLTDRLHSYKIRTETPNDQLGYWEAEPGSPPPDGQYILHYVGGKIDGEVARTEIDFAPPCDMTIDTPTALKWFDADWAANGALGPWYISPNFSFNEYNASGVLVKSTPITGGSAPDIGGNNAYRELNFVAHPGWKYTWVWRNMNTAFGVSPYGPANNVQMWIPFDSINYNLSCYDYHSTVAPADGKNPAVKLDFSNPANLHVEISVNAINNGPSQGPTAHTTPTSTSAFSFPDPGGGSGDINEPIPGFQTLNNQAQYGFFLNPLTPTNTVLCFGDTIAPNSDSVASIPSDNQVCYTVLNDRRFPAVTSSNGDVHAGGGWCTTGALQTEGFVKGSPGGLPAGSSLGQYVVSTYSTPTGTINDFGSNNAVSGSANDKLNIGATGAYQSVCRPDAYAAATSYRTLHPLTPSFPGGTYDISGWSNLVYLDGDSTIYGTVNNKLTIVSTAGDVHIGAPGIKFNTAAPAVAGNQQPSLGIIAANNIDIAAAVTQVDAYLFADGAIDTCFEGNSSTTACSTNALTVNGFMMANTLALHRTGVPNALGSSVAERVTLVPQLYLNPPIFFDATTLDQNNLQGGGERAPLF